MRSREYARQVVGLVRTFPTGRPPDRVRIPKSPSALAEISAICQLAARREW